MQRPRITTSSVPEGGATSSALATRAENVRPPQQEQRGRALATENCFPALNLREFAKLQTRFRSVTLFSFQFLPFGNRMAIPYLSHCHILEADDLFARLQGHRWSGILPLDGPYPKCHPKLTENLDLESMLEFLRLWEMLGLGSHIFCMGRT